MNASESCCNRKVIVVDNESLVVNELCRIIETSAENAVRDNGCFNIAVSGGSVVNMLVKGLPSIKTDWPKWTVIFCDERIVPAHDKESTFGLYKDNLIPATPLEAHQFISIDFSFANNPKEKASEAATDYENRLKKHFQNSSMVEISGVKYPRLDCAILGMGPDGHTCSLFPGATESLLAKSWVIPVVDSPKPPPNRVSLTLPFLNSARVAIFPITGSSKSSTVKSILEDNKDLPANLVKPKDGVVYWILDSFAASILSK